MEMDVKAKGGLKINDKLEAFNQRFPGTVSVQFTVHASDMKYDSEVSMESDCGLKWLTPGVVSEQPYPHRHHTTHLLVS